MFCLWAAPRRDGACDSDWAGLSSRWTDWLKRVWPCWGQETWDGDTHFVELCCGTSITEELLLFGAELCINHLSDSSLSYPWLSFFHGCNESPLLPHNVNLKTFCWCLRVKAFQQCSIQFGSAQVSTAQGKSAHIVFVFFSIISFIVM